MHARVFKPWQTRRRFPCVSSAGEVKAFLVTGWRATFGNVGGSLPPSSSQRASANSSSLMDHSRRGEATIRLKPPISNSPSIPKWLPIPKCAKESSPLSFMSEAATLRCGSNQRTVFTRVDLHQFPSDTMGCRVRPRCANSQKEKSGTIDRNRVLLASGVRTPQLALEKLKFAGFTGFFWRSIANRKRCIH